MKITKFEHSCMILEANAENIIIDAGILTKQPTKNIINLSALIYTHKHPDHLDKDLLVKLVSRNPKVVIYAPQDVIDEIKEIECQKTAVYSGLNVQLDNFLLEFTGNDHAIISQNVPCQNVGVLINKKFYYPGDSFILPVGPVDVLAVPASAPWMKASEAMQFMAKIKPKVVFPAHNGLLSSFGEQVTYNWLSQAADNIGCKWQVLQTNDHIDV